MRFSMLLSSSRRKYLREDACVIRANDDLHFPKLLFAKELCNKIGKQKSLPNQFLSVDRYIARIFNIFAEMEYNFYGSYISLKDKYSRESLSFFASEKCNRGSLSGKYIHVYGLLSSSQVAFLFIECEIKGIPRFARSSGKSTNLSRLVLKISPRWNSVVGLIR